MTGAPQIKGWCPGALRPMLSGDGWVVRVRPRGGRLSTAQVAGIAQAAQEFGNGMLDLSSRANLQIRGVREASHGALIAALRALDLIDATAQAEARRNVILSPFADEAAQGFAQALERGLTATNSPDLPGKFGFVVDCGAVPVLQDAPGDIRLERAADGQLLLCAEGLARGKPLAAGEAGAQALALAAYFLDQGGAAQGRGRMAGFVAAGAALPEGFDQPRQTGGALPAPGIYPQGVLAGLAFGQIDAAGLSALAGLGALRLTPWRMVLIEGQQSLPDLPGLILRGDDPLLRIVACTGAPGCAQAQGDTRDLARHLAGQLPPGARLHVSGCSKGCAHPRPAPVTVVASAQGYDIIRDGTAADRPAQCGLSPQELGKAI